MCVRSRAGFRAGWGFKDLWDGNASLGFKRRAVFQPGNGATPAQPFRFKQDERRMEPTSRGLRCAVEPVHGTSPWPCGSISSAHWAGRADGQAKPFPHLRAHKRIHPEADRIESSETVRVELDVLPRRFFVEQGPENQNVSRGTLPKIKMLHVKQYPETPCLSSPARGQTNRSRHPKPRQRRMRA